MPVLYSNVQHVRNIVKMFQFKLTNACTYSIHTISTYVNHRMLELEHRNILHIEILDPPNIPESCVLQAGLLCVTDTKVAIKLLII